ncbi:TPA: hypothetical protein DCZ39_06900 [Patescibacteria group bacterium]|nr:hypothetical protein [Candidatus Gracilibacteria bacterium]
MVGHVLLYMMVPVIGVLSILVTVAITLPVFPARSLKVNVNVPFQVNIFDAAFSHVIVSENPVTVAVTF